MARWGEGDERWIVSDRPDGTNVNGWHWVRVFSARFQKQLHTGRARTAPPPVQLECFSPGVISRRTGSSLLFVVVTDARSRNLWASFGTPLSLSVFPSVSSGGAQLPGSSPLSLRHTTPWTRRGRCVHWLGEDHSREGRQGRGVQLLALGVNPPPPPACP